MLSRMMPEIPWTMVWWPIVRRALLGSRVILPSRTMVLSRSDGSGAFEEGSGEKELGSCVYGIVCVESNTMPEPSTLMVWSAMVILAPALMLLPAMTTSPFAP